MSPSVEAVAGQPVAGCVRVPDLVGESLLRGGVIAASYSPSRTCRSTRSALMLANQSRCPVAATHRSAASSTPNRSRSGMLVRHRVAPTHPQCAVATTRRRPGHPGGRRLADPAPVPGSGDRASAAGVACHVQAAASASTARTRARRTSSCPAASGIPARRRQRRLVTARVYRIPRPVHQQTSRLHTQIFSHQGVLLALARLAWMARTIHWSMPILVRDLRWVGIEELVPGREVVNRSSG